MNITIIPIWANCPKQCNGHRSCSLVGKDAWLSPRRPGFEPLRATTIIVNNIANIANTNMTGAAGEGNM